MKPTAMALDAATGSFIGQKVLNSHPRHGAIRGIIVDEERIICTGYVDNDQPGFLFVADGAKPAVWEFDKMGNLVKEKILNISGLGQGAKIRKDHSTNGGYIMTSTAWATFNGKERNSVALVKFSRYVTLHPHKFHPQHFHPPYFHPALLMWNGARCMD